jgi:hypothetical protein
LDFTGRAFEVKHGRPKLVRVLAAHDPRQLGRSVKFISLAVNVPASVPLRR